MIEEKSTFLSLDACVSWSISAGTSWLGRHSFAEAHDRGVGRRVLRLRGASARHLAFGARKLCLGGGDLGVERARLLALGRDDQHPRRPESGGEHDGDEDHAIASGHRALAPEVVGAAAVVPALVESETLFVVAATAEVLGSGSKVTVALKAGSLAAHATAGRAPLRCPPWSSEA